jgi:hypothetical protein
MRSCTTPASSTISAVGFPLSSRLTARDRLVVCGLEAGVIDYRRLLRQFPALSSIPTSIELPIRFGYDAAFHFGLRQNLPIPSLDSVRRILKDSLDYLAAALPQAA